MSKQSEQRALEAYPVRGEWIGNQYGDWDEDINSTYRKAFVQGYEQAEKDLALTWNDIAIIDDMLREVANYYATNDLSELTREDFYSEVLNRFNKIKEEK